MVGLVAKYQRYAEYKDSGVEWLGEIPHEWRTSQLKRVACFITGMTPSTSVLAYYSDDISEYEWVRPEDIRENVEFVQCTKYLTKLGWETQRAIPSKSVLLCCIGTIGKAAYNSYPLTTNQQITSVVLKNSSSKYYFYLLLAARTELEQMATGNVVKILNSERLGKLPIPVLSAQEAQKIANFLDHETTKIDSLIEKQKQLIQLLKEKRQAVISHAVTKGLDPRVKMKDSGVEWLGEVPEHWTIPQIGYHAEVTKLTGFEYTNLWMPQEDGKIIALRGFNIQERYLDLNKTERISKNLSRKLFRSKLFKGDLVLPCTGTLGNAALIESDDTFHINQNIAKVTYDKRLFVPEFCLYWVTSQPFRQMIDFNNTSGMQPVLLIGDIRKLPIPLCFIDEQIKIVAYLDNQTQKMGELIRKAESAIQLMQERRTALISAAVTGKIDVRDWQSPHMGLGTQLNEEFKKLGLVNAGFTLPERPIE